MNEELDCPCGGKIMRMNSWDVIVRYQCPRCGRGPLDLIAAKKVPAELVEQRCVYGHEDCDGSPTTCLARESEALGFYDIQLSAPDPIKQLVATEALKVYGTGTPGQVVVPMHIALELMEAGVVRPEDVPPRVAEEWLRRDV